MNELLHAEALDALLTEATRPQRWQSRNQMASECGIHPTTLSLAVKGKRGLSDAAMDAIEACTGWSREVLYVPVRARSGQLQTRLLVTAVERLRDQVSADLLSGTDEIARAIAESK